MSFTFVVNDMSAEIKAAFSGKELAASNTMVGQIAIAATNAIHDAGVLFKEKGRANIASAGFSARWQNAWRVKVFPEWGYSLDAALWAYHKIPYAGVFEKGARIVGKSGMLWLPLPTAPRGKGRRGSPLSIPPKALASQGVRLFSVRRAGKPPLLATSVRVTKAQAGRRDLRLSLSKLKRGASGKRGTVVALPLYVGLSQVAIRKRFDIEGVAATVRARMPELYVNNLRG